MRRVIVAALVALSLMVGCSRQQIPPEERREIEHALVKYWAKRDKQARVTLKTVRVEGDKATIEFALKFPEFHSVATTRKAFAEKRNGHWTLVRVED